MINVITALNILRPGRFALNQIGNRGTDLRGKPYLKLPATASQGQ